MEWGVAMKNKEVFKVVDCADETLVVILTQKSKKEYNTEIYQVKDGATQLKVKETGNYVLGSGIYLELLKMIGFKNRSALTASECELVNLCLNGGVRNGQVHG